MPSTATNTVLSRLTPETQRLGPLAKAMVDMVTSKVDENSNSKGLYGVSPDRALSGTAYVEAIEDAARAGESKYRTSDTQESLREADTVNLNVVVDNYTEVVDTFGPTLIIDDDISHSYSAKASQKSGSDGAKIGAEDVRKANLAQLFIDLDGDKEKAGVRLPPAILYFITQLLNQQHGIIGLTGNALAAALDKIFTNSDERITAVLGGTELGFPADIKITLEGKADETTGVFVVKAVHVEETVHVVNLLCVSNGDLVNEEGHRQRKDKLVAQAKLPEGDAGKTLKPYASITARYCFKLKPRIDQSNQKCPVTYDPKMKFEYRGKTVKTHAHEMEQLLIRPFFTRVWEFLKQFFKIEPRVETKELDASAYLGPLQTPQPTQRQQKGDGSRPAVSVTDVPSTTAADCRKQHLIEEAERNRTGGNSLLPRSTLVS